MSITSTPIQNVGVLICLGEPMPSLDDYNSDKIKFENSVLELYDDQVTQNVYADFLEDNDDARGALLRVTPKLEEPFFEFYGQDITIHHPKYSSFVPGFDDSGIPVRLAKRERNAGRLLSLVFFKSALKQLLSQRLGLAKNYSDDQQIQKFVFALLKLNELYQCRLVSPYNRDSIVSKNLHLLHYHVNLLSFHHIIHLSGHRSIINNVWPCVHRLVERFNHPINYLYTGLEQSCNGNFKGFITTAYELHAYTYAKEPNTTRSFKLFPSKCYTQAFNIWKDLKVWELASKVRQERIEYFQSQPPRSTDEKRHRIRCHKLECDHKDINGRSTIKNYMDMFVYPPPLRNFNSESHIPSNYNLVAKMLTEREYDYYKTQGNCTYKKCSLCDYRPKFTP